MPRHEIPLDPLIEPSRSPIIPAVWGGLLGVLLVIVHVALDVFNLVPDCSLPLHPQSLHDGNPFTHVLSEFAILGIGGAVVFALVAKAYNRLRRD